MTRALLAIIFVAAAGYSVDPARAQTAGGGIRGIVRDATGAILAGVTVEATSPALIGTRVEVSDSQGLYQLERLPLGIYRVVFTLPGFTTVVRENVRVEAGRTIDIDSTLAVGAVAETVTVSGASPVVDSLHAGTTTNFNLELLQNIPSTRTSWFDTVAFMPAVRTDQQTANSATFLLYGSNSDQNSYQFEGMDITGLGSGIVWDFPNPDIIQELQVVGVGASAEHAGFQGGIVNLVTKSGSNRFKGRASFFLTEDSMVSNNTPNEPLPYQVDYYQDYTWEIGGPVKKDRVWFAAIFELLRYRQSQVGVDINFAPKLQRFRDFFKVNAKLSASDLLDVAYNDNNYDSAGQTSRTRPPETVVRDRGHNPIVTTRWTRTMGSSTVLEARGGYMYAIDKNTPPNGDFETPGRFNISTGDYSVNIQSASYSTFQKPSLAAALTHHASDFLKGSHEFKFGVQFAPQNSIVGSGPFMGNKFYYDLGGLPYYVLVREPNANAGRVATSGVFVQDNWTTDRVTLNLGVRFDHTSADVPATNQRDAQFEETDHVYAAIPDLIGFNDMSPRLGLTVKLDSTGKTVGKVSYGRYYGRLNTNMFSAISPGNTVTNAFLYTPATGLYDRPYFTTNPNINYAIDPDLHNQYTDQLFIGLEREVLPDLGVEVSYIRKKEQEFLRVDDVRGVYAPQPFVDTFRGQSQTLSVLNLQGASSTSLFQVTNRDDFRQDYNSVVLSAYKRLSSAWQLHGSYQWQQARGLAGGGLGIGSQAFSGLGTGGFGRDPNDLTNAYGRFASDSTHSAKVNFTFEAPLGIHVGLRESFETGRPYGRLITVRGLRQGNRNILAEPRGTYELPSTNNFQIRLDKDFRFGADRRFRVSLDIFNVFNEATPVSVRNNSSQGEALFGQSLEVFAPRRAMVGFRIEF
jgi:hypothetical protein